MNLNPSIIALASTEDKVTAVDVAQLADEVVDLPGEQVHEGALLGRRTDRVHPSDARLQERVLQPDGAQKPLDMKVRMTTVRRAGYLSATVPGLKYLSLGCVNSPSPCYNALLGCWEAKFTQP